MTPFTGDYYEHEGQLYRRVKMTPKGYHLKDKTGKYRWITMKKILEIIAKRSTK